MNAGFGSRPPFIVQVKFDVDAGADAHNGEFIRPGIGPWGWVGKLATGPCAMLTWDGYFSVQDAGRANCLPEACIVVWADSNMNAKHRFAEDYVFYCELWAVIP